MDTVTRLLRQIARSHRKVTATLEDSDACVAAQRAILVNVAVGLFGESIRNELPTAPECDALGAAFRDLAISAIADHDEQTRPRVGADLLAAVHEQLAAPSGVGVHYTPHRVADYIAESAIAELISTRCDVDPETAKSIVSTTPFVEIDGETTRRILRLLKTTDVCDPSCGTGHLLLAAAETLARAEMRLLGNLEPTSKDAGRIRRRIAMRRLHGRDIDVDAVAITRLRLAAWAADTGASSEVKIPADNVHARDMLKSSSARLDQERRFDVILMNPPYVPTYSRRSQCDHREPIRTFAAQRELSGRLNLFGCFIIRAMEIVKAGGVVSLIVPDTFASAGAYADLRRALTVNYGRQQWTRIDARVFKAQVGSVILTCSDRDDSLSADFIDIPRKLSAESSRLRSTPLAAIRGDEHQILFFDNEIEQSIWRMVRTADTLPLKSFARVRDGVNTGPRRMRESLLEPAAPSIFRRPLIEGGDIDPRGFVLHEPARTILYNPDMIDDDARLAGASLRDPAIFDAPKVVTRQTADSLIAALEPAGGVVALNSVHCISVEKNEHSLLPGLMALLNSPLIRLYYALDGGEQRAILPQVRIAWLRELPVARDVRRFLAELAPMGEEIIERLRTNAGIQDSMDRLHDTVCRAYGIPTHKYAHVLACYHHRFPRFADLATLTRRPRSVRVA
ncbi:MAG: N-6 DNA methylase [Phycisphaerales bacterium]|nr:N-6 DNA methylase [Phycisphaerales bacterium]MCB9855452.1 N-6 DNA methylase [Phycisphaerales bacterium]MCB9864228.1 N-6 DNA methylase [Phycisphaerales bacterium]